MCTAFTRILSIICYTFGLANPLYLTVGLYLSLAIPRSSNKDSFFFRPLDL